MWLFHLHISLQDCFPERGWKRVGASITARPVFFLYKTASPKGDGNSKSNTDKKCKQTLQDCFPERGWKHLEMTSGMKEQVTTLQDCFPERGWKLKEGTGN